MEWPTEKLLRLIELFRSKRCLWDPQDRNYKKSYIKDKAWNSISDELGGNAIETKKKMESLLASYRRERKKCELALASSGPNKVFISKWFAFKAMSFMSNRSSIRRPQYDHNGTMEETLEEESTQDSFEPHRNRPTLEETSRKSASFEELPSQSEEEQNKTVCCHKNMQISENNNRDDSDIFGQYIATKHRKYSAHVRNVLEHQIAQILFDADMGLYNPGTTTTVTISSRSPIIETQSVQSTEMIYEK